MIVERFINSSSGPRTALRRAIRLIGRKKFTVAFPLLTRAAAGMRRRNTGSRDAILKVRVCRHVDQTVC